MPQQTGKTLKKQKSKSLMKFVFHNFEHISQLFLVFLLLTWNK